MEEAGSILGIWLVATGKDGKTAGRPAPTLRGSQGEHQKPERPPCQKRQSSTPLTNTCPDEHMHVHPTCLYLPPVWGEETEDPCDTPCGSHVCLSPLDKLSAGRRFRPST